MPCSGDRESASKSHFGLTENDTRLNIAQTQFFENLLCTVTADAIEMRLTGLQISSTHGREKPRPSHGDGRMSQQFGLWYSVLTTGLNQWECSVLGTGRPWYFVYEEKHSST